MGDAFPASAGCGHHNRKSLALYIGDTLPDLFSLPSGSLVRFAGFREAQHNDAMGAVADRIQVIVKSLGERWRHGLPEAIGPMDGDVFFILDGVGGFQFAPLMVRRVLRGIGTPVGTVVYRWQFGVTGEIWTDLMWLRRNRVMAARLARKLRAFRRAHPTSRVHLFGYSGGAGIAVMACEFLGGTAHKHDDGPTALARPIVDTLVLAAPALSPEYNLASALRCVRRCIAWIRPRDRHLLGWGTRLFGTIDRKHCRAAGMLGFRIPPNASDEVRASYDRLEQILWTPELRTHGTSGGHIGWLNERFLKEQVERVILNALG
jgi:hypothetical protein